MSLNVVFARLSAGSGLTRSTHPRFLRLAENLLHVLGCTSRLHNVLFDLTKADVVERLQRLGLDDVIPLTYSCARRHMTSRLQPHCGTCSQCLDRRFATEFAHLSSTTDHPRSYAKDVFVDGLASAELPVAEGLLRWSADAQEMTFESFLEENPALLDATSPDGPQDEQLEQIYELHRRYGNQILSVLSRKYSEHSVALAKGTLPPSCLLRVIAGQRLDDLQRCASHLTDMVSRALPKLFRRRKPTDERELQDAIEGILAARDAELKREHPGIYFAAKFYKPDFSASSGRLWIEVKYPRKTRPAHAIIDEISSDIVAYRSSASSLLFLVYDPHTLMPDEQQLNAAYSGEATKIFIRLLR